MYNEYRNGNVTIINDNEDYCKADINTSKGHTHKRKFLLIADNEYNNEFDVVVANLSHIEQEKLFNMLDASLHDKPDTSIYMENKILSLENTIDNMHKALGPNTNTDPFDCEYDFY